MAAVHLFPFSVAQDCSINSQTFLHVSPETREEHRHKSLDTLQTVVRGRRLVGLDVKLPDTVQGHLWKEKDDDDQHVWVKQKASKIDRFVLWKKDTAPSDQDPRLKSIENWLNVAECIHEPIPLE
ncbi:predicted protein [Lichtheimia corymbifera JMRC:FSU:9682]|uniref:Uncharacterized protein n=1 Tax=Lichtheimia corymbifera JMRC:FSU:9682 TaxID=1263082 RepID=A0A068S926_9FUNG|nr:predicted protein [Lichtheimia corymbifera JMRC:FSU:9682]